LKHLKLSGLGHLQVDIASLGGSQSLVVGDVAPFTALTGLTYLGLPHGGACVGCEQATTLAHSLLHFLDLSHCGLGGMACTAAIASLPHLTQLNLNGCPGLTREGLMVLTQLSCLQLLDVDRSDEVTDAVLDSFWATLCGNADPLQPDDHALPEVASESNDDGFYD
jgi:hypothetical protein